MRGNAIRSARFALNALGTRPCSPRQKRTPSSGVIYATSISAVGPTSGPVGDDTRLSPGNVYGATKAFCEHLAAAMSTRPNAPCYLGLRFGYVYGPGRVRGWRDVQQIVERVAAGERSIEYPDYRDADRLDVDRRRGARAGSHDRAAASAKHRGQRRRRQAHDARCGRAPETSLPRPSAHVASLRRRRPPRGGSSTIELQALLGTVPATTLEQGIDHMLAAAASQATAP